MPRAHAHARRFKIASWLSGRLAQDKKPEASGEGSKKKRRKKRSAHARRQSREASLRQKTEANRVTDSTAGQLFELKYVGLGLLHREPQPDDPWREELRIVTGVVWEPNGGSGWHVVTGTLRHRIDVFNEKIVDSIEAGAQDPAAARTFPISKALSSKLHAYNKRFHPTTKQLAAAQAQASATAASLATEGPEGGAAAQAAAGATPSEAAAAGAATAGTCVLPKPTRPPVPLCVGERARERAHSLRVRWVREPLIRLPRVHSSSRARRARVGGRQH